MVSSRLVCCLLGAAIGAAAEQPTAAGIFTALSRMSIDPAATYRVRDLEIARGDIKIYLTEGLLSFATPVNGKRVAAVFTTQGVEAGDGEVILLPNRASERASLSRHAKTPNIDEHITSALFVFSDDTANVLLHQIQQNDPHPATDIADALAKSANPLLSAVAAAVDVRLVHSLLDSHKPEDGFFYSFVMGRQLGQFDLLYDPTDFEPIAAGRPEPTKEGFSAFHLWTSFRPRHAPPYMPQPAPISDYRIDITFAPDLSMNVSADFTFKANASTGRTVALQLSHHLQVVSATVDGVSAEVFQHHESSAIIDKSFDTFLVISQTPLADATAHRIQVRYEGTVVHKTGNGDYFVDDRNSWYPFISPTVADFDLTFHVPGALQLVATGEPLTNDVKNGQRTVHRRTRTPVELAGFNLGDYAMTDLQQGPYRVQCYENRSGSSEMGSDLLTETGRILDFYTRQWTELPIRTVAVTPIAGYFGQGFPGLIYLSEVSYTPMKDRPLALRNSELDSFFNELLLPHEIAHQWWGNVVRAADYRTGWLTEAMANYSALEFLDKEDGPGTAGKLLSLFRADLMRKENGQTLESAGPIDFGERLIEPDDLRRWHAITYEKGAWVLQMLEQRLGEANFRKMQLRLLSEYASRPITNDELREVAASFLPPGQPDRSLENFFDTWVYGTGVPQLELRHAGNQLRVDVSGVDDDFTADLPLACGSSSGKKIVHWVRINSGANPVELKNAANCTLPALDEFLFVP